MDAATPEHRAGPASAVVAAALGPLAALVAAPDVTDVLVNGDTGVWVDRGDGLERTTVLLQDDRSVRRLAVRLAGLAGRRLDDSSPWVDGLLPGGIRLHALLPPLVDGAAHLSLRVARRRSPDLDQLHAWGALDDRGLAVVRAVVRARRSFVVTGGTGSGKTTMLAAMLADVPAEERIVVVEDVRELQVDHPHVVHLQGRTDNVEGRGAVTLTDLVRQSLRMRPDRLIVGEVRGAEVRELLGALNTGHDGGGGTVHANTAEDLVVRMEALGALAGMSREAVHAQLGSAIEVVLHVARRADGRRLLDQVGVLQRPRPGEPLMSRPALLRSADGWQQGPGWATLTDLLDGQG